MPEDYYGDAGGAEATPEAAPEETPDESATGLLPKDFFQGKPLEVGTRCEVEIKRVHDNQVEVSYVPHEETETPAEESTEDAAGGPEEEMMSLMG